MAYQLTNDTMNINTPGALVVNVGSSGLNQVAGTGTGTSTSVACQRWEFFDYTTTQAIPATTQVVTGGIGDFQYPHQQFRALVNLKGVIPMTATSTSAYGLIVALEAATSTASWVGTGSTGNMKDGYVLDSKFLVQTSNTATGNTQIAYLFGTMPTVGGAQYARISFYSVNAAGQTAVASTAVDAVIEGI